jgi:glyoxylase-like metal-dependent hydrolase (beta-lactamase superfamily II)/rhodanese-related sulfurtransferase
VVTVEIAELGNRAYLVHDGAHALVVDPPRDIVRAERAAEEAGVRIEAVAETHVHNDFVSGGPALARRHRAEHLVAGAEQVDFPRVGVSDGDALDVGSLRVEVMGTPGHTPHHLAFLATAPDAPDAADPALFSGGSLLYGTVGRTDLSGRERTEGLTREQYRSARRLAARLPRRTALFPTHGFGSFCASTSACSASSSTLAAEAADNLALTVDDEDAFVEMLLGGLGPVPSYYAHMAALNRAGHGLTDVPGLSRLGPESVCAALARGASVVDLRNRREFAAAHLRDSLNFEYGSTCGTYVGWMLPWGEEIVLVSGSAEQLAAAHEDLARIGIDRLAGGVVGLPGSGTPEVRAYPCRRWEDLQARYAEDGRRPDIPVVLDVRQRAEYEAGHLARAISMPVQDVPQAGGRIPPGPVWVHCRSGFRAAVAASFLHAAGRRVVLIDDDWERAETLGLPVESGAPVGAAV